MRALNSHPAPSTDCWAETAPVKRLFFNIIYGEYDSDAGEVLLEIDGFTRPIGSSDVGMLFAEPFLPDFLTGEEFLRFFCDTHNVSIDQDALFEEVSFDPQDRRKLMKDYSSGMKNKIMLMMLLIQKPAVILLDEPLSSLDIVVQAQMKKMLSALKRDHILL